MSKKEIINSNECIAYASVLGGLQIHHINDDTVYCVSGAWCRKKSFHKVKIHYNSSVPYIKVNGLKISLDEIIRC